MKRHIFRWSVLLVFSSLLLSCWTKSSGKNTSDTEKEEHTTPVNYDEPPMPVPEKEERTPEHEAYIQSLKTEYLIEIPNGLPERDPESIPPYTFFYDESGEGEDDETISTGGQGDEYEITLARKLKLGEKWLCITFPDTRNHNDRKLEVDTLRTDGHIEVTYPTDHTETTLSVEDKKRNYRIYAENQRQEGEAAIHYDIAFRGDYDPQTDFHYYEKRPITRADSLHITSVIKNAMNKKQVEIPLWMSSEMWESPILYPAEMYRLTDDMYGARYIRPYDEESYKDFLGDQYYFLIKGDRVLFWDVGPLQIKAALMNLKGEDMLWVSTIHRYSLIINLYKLSNTSKPIYTLGFSD